MCGIFGYISTKSTPSVKLRKQVDLLFRLSESRGKEAAGIAILNNDQITVYKDNIPASKMLKSREYRSYFKDAVNNCTTPNFACIGHSRLVTNGSQETNDNNQPVIKDGFVIIHNGIITNVDELYTKHPGIRRKYEVDSEIIPGLLHEYLNHFPKLTHAIIKTYNEIEGAASIACFSDKLNSTILATNNGSLYYCRDSHENQFIFASERYILEKAIKTNPNFIPGSVKWLPPFSGLIIDNNDLNSTHFTFNENNHSIAIENNQPVFQIANKSKQKNSDVIAHRFYTIHPGILQYNIHAIKLLKRCSLCVLPETFPFIKFDDKGVCNYCRNHKKIYGSDAAQQQKMEKLHQIINTYRRFKKTDFEVIVPFSGGRDSSYGLHYLRTILDLNIITFTYDWGMITDLARRNVARLCGKLGIENILISANIAKKRKYIRENILAWLKKPDLGIIPLFMAGDKQFLYYLNKLKKQTNIQLNIWMGNKLETTDFKSGFAGIPPNFGKISADKLRFSGKMSLIFYYLKHYFTNPGYLNSSIPDTLGAYYSYYIQPRNDFYLLYDFLKWDESAINETLINEYNWEISPDTKSTWRIGDGTAAFYNYTYYTVAGFSEIDTFRSNQIREGMLTREEALNLIHEENRPRYDSLKWYFETIQIDFEQAIKVINQIPKLYQL